MYILIHTSKTMREPLGTHDSYRSPQLIAPAAKLAAYLTTLTAEQIQTVMQISPKLARSTNRLILDWSQAPTTGRIAVDSFLGDIYSGLQVANLSEDDRDYADQNLGILSGLYGLIRPLDTIYPYRLEMGYRLPDSKFRNLYDYWGDQVARLIPPTGPIINLAAVEYAKLATKYLDADRFITPSFLTLSSKTGEPTFVVVHAKIARGAFANWLVTSRLQDLAAIKDFNGLGYRYNSELSTETIPVFICKEFGGLGLSVRLS